MIWEGLIVTRGPFNMFQNILDLLVEIETCLSEHFSKIGTDINIAPGRMEHMSTFVREMENDLSHGDNMFF
jgi:hypothetical protein